MQGQSKISSVIESTANMLTGMIIAFALSQMAHTYETQIQYYIWTDFHWQLSAGSNMIMTTILTAVSVIRGYLWRRYFNKRLVKTFDN